MSRPKSIRHELDLQKLNQLDLIAARRILSKLQDQISREAKMGPTLELDHLCACQQDVIQYILMRLNAQLP